ncbi:hypothetical protein QAD02_005358 [Eretmocerus hayati]|uniref:Uncharacterized protein n=1 Tax=Eretmocerus hayati TaxID=131215 RepID=A0ACC2NU08_9HYME|nr:hypothetical protein QAD02_005358 [Eretmocerus hayati]
MRRYSVKIQNYETKNGRDSMSQLIVGRHFPMYKVEPMEVNSEELQLVTRVFDLPGNDIMRALHNLEVSIEFSCCLQLGMATVNVPIAHSVLESAFDNKIFTSEVQREERFLMNMLPQLEIA